MALDFAEVCSLRCMMKTGVPVMSMRLPFYLMLVLSLLVAVASWRFLGLGLDLSFPGFEDHLAARRMVFTLHVALAPVALALGGFQFLSGVRTRRPVLHRWTGRLYAICVAISGFAGLWLALFAPGGWIAGLGFGLLAILWLVATAKAVLHARRREFAQHRLWMVRSFALTFAGVTLRLFLAGYILSGVSYVDASPVLAWICWVPNILIVEWWIARDKNRSVKTATG